MKLTEQVTEKATVLGVEGRIDSTTSVVLEKKLIAMIDENGVKNLVLDFAVMDYINSAGLRVLLTAVKRVSRAGGRIALAGLIPNVREVFDVAGFSPMFGIHPNREEALRSF